MLNAFLLTHFMPSEVDGEATIKDGHLNVTSTMKKKGNYRHETILMDRTDPIFLCFEHQQKLRD